MWQRFTERARKVVFYAQEEAGRLGQNIVGPEHLLLGIARDPNSLGALILEQLGVRTWASCERCSGGPKSRAAKADRGRTCSLRRAPKPNH